MLDRIQFLIAEGFLALRRNGWMTFAAITTVTVALFFLGGLGRAYDWLQFEAAKTTGVIDIRATVRDDTPSHDLSRIAQEIRQIKGVKAAFLIPKDNAWKKFLSENPKHRQYAELENPYPDSFKITLTDLKLAESVVDSVAKVKGIRQDEVKYLAQVTQFFVQMQGLVSWLGLSVGGLLFVTAGILIYNSIRLTVISRRLEIRIMQLVGASFLTVRIPFYIEGVIQGLVGGILAVCLVFCGQTALAFRFQFTELDFPWKAMFLILPSLGAVYGLLCSMIAVRTPLRYR